MLAIGFVPHISFTTKQKQTLAKDLEQSMDYGTLVKQKWRGKIQGTMSLNWKWLTWYFQNSQIQLIEMGHQVE